MNRLGLMMLLVAVITSIIAIPQTINYQGKLTDMSGVGENDTLDIRFRIFDVETGGDSLWAMTIADVPVVHGLFDVNIGPIDLPFDEQYWLEIVVDGEVLAPRVQLTSSPYAFRAAVADSFTGGVPPWTQDTMVAHWDSLRGIPADIADGDQIDTTIAHWGTIRDIPAEIADGDDIIETRDTMIAYWDSLRGVPDNLGNSDTIWSKDSEIADTIVIMSNTKIHGELIADSIQAVGDNITLDDHIDIYGCANFYVGAIETVFAEGFESGDPPIGWEEEYIVGASSIDYVAVSSNPDGYYPTEGSLMLQSRCGSEYGSTRALNQTTGFSTIGYSSLVLSFDMLHDTSWPTYNCYVWVYYSLDGAVWQALDTLVRVDGSTGWKTESVPLPSIANNQPAVFIRLVFAHLETMVNVHIDNLIVTGRGYNPPYELANSICGGYFIGDGSGLTNTYDWDWIRSGDNMYSSISGKIGIGTDTPLGKLHVISNDDNVFVNIQNSQNTNGSISGIQFNNSILTGNYQFKNAVLSKRTGSYGRSDLIFATENSANYDNVDTTDARMIIKSNGNVGIGTTAPASLLEVAGNTRTQYFQMTDGATDGYILQSDASGNASWIDPVTITTADDGDWTISGSDMYSAVSGNVGIGTTTPVDLLHIEAYDDTVGDDDSVFISVRNSCNNDSVFAGIRFKNHSTDGDNLYKSGIVFQRLTSYGRGSLLFLNDDQSNNSNADLSDVRMTIASNGNIGIGTTTPSKTLTIQGSGTLSNWLQFRTSSGDDIWHISFQDSVLNFCETGVAANRLCLKAGGNVGIGTDTPTEKLDVDGNAKVSGYITVDTISSPLDTLYIDEKVWMGELVTDSIEARGDVVKIRDNLHVTGNLTVDGSYPSGGGGGTYSVGDFALGGIVFWVDETGQHGLVCAKEDQSTGVRWYAGTYGVTRATGDGPFSGELNTSIIISSQVSIGDDGADYAAQICNDLQVTEGSKTYGDWYLPSKEELNLMYQNKAAIDSIAGANGGSSFAGAFYWSSNENDTSYAWLQYFNTGVQISRTKSGIYYVRAIRAF